MIPGGNGVTNTWSAHMFEYYGSGNYIDNVADTNEPGIPIDKIPIKEPGANSVYTPDRFPDNSNNGIFDNNPFLRPTPAPTPPPTPRPTPAQTPSWTPPPTPQSTPPPTPSRTPPPSRVTPAPIPDTDARYSFYSTEIKFKNNIEKVVRIT